MDYNGTLINAIKNKEGLIKVQELIALGANINYAPIIEQGLVPKSVINYAAESGDLEVVKYLHALGAKPFTYKNFGNNHEFYLNKAKNPLFSYNIEEYLKPIGRPLAISCCASGNRELIQWAEDIGESLENCVNEAAGSGNLLTVKWLVEEKQIAIDDYSIVEAIPNEEMVDYLFAHDVNIRNDGMDTYMAIQYDDIRSLKKILGKGSLCPQIVINLSRSKQDSNVIKILEDNCKYMGDNPTHEDL